MSCDHQEDLKEWLCSRTGLVPLDGAQFIGSIRNGKILGVVGFDDYNGSLIQMHAAGDPGWLDKSVLFACFTYAFDSCGVSVILCRIPSVNADALRFSQAVGFKVSLVLDGAHPEGSLWFMTMTRGECRFLNRKHNG